MSSDSNKSNQHSNQQELRLRLQTPVGDDRPIYLAGNHNDWQTTDQASQLEQTGPGTYEIVLGKGQALPPVLSYKYHRSPGWSAVETLANGEVPQNREVSTAVGMVEDRVPNWQRDGLYYRPEFLPKIKVISEAFEMPQLIRTRRVAALLPHDYDKTDRRYPVLYLQDGQNLFDDYAPFGNWAVDKRLAMMAARGRADVIIISIDHAAEQRAAEFTPSYPTKIGSGDGEHYAGWLTETLKPYVDRNFRTLPDREHTGIGGSSMGGLISIYAGLLYPEVFGKLMIFSPSLWVSPDISLRSGQCEYPFHGKVYLYGGGQESAGMVPLLEKLKKALQDQCRNYQIDIELRIEEEGRHEEAFWGMEFPRALEWLYYQEEFTKQS